MDEIIKTKREALQWLAVYFIEIGTMVGLLGYCLFVEDKGDPIIDALILGLVAGIIFMFYALNSVNKAVKDIKANGQWH